jgi:hypothetical protein
LEASLEDARHCYIPEGLRTTQQSLLLLNEGALPNIAGQFKTNAKKNSVKVIT